MSETRDVYRAHTYQDLLNSLPAMFGFMPYESVVGLSTSGWPARFGFRLRHDLPPATGRDDLARMLAAHLVHHGGDDYMVFALSADAEAARAMAVALTEALPARRVQVTLWATSDRVWSDHPDFPHDGEAFALDPHHEATVRAIAEGRVILPDRAALHAEVRGAEGERARWLEVAHELVLERFVGRAVTSDPADFTAGEIRDVLRLMDRAVAGDRLTDGELVEVAVRVSPTPVRDACWARIDRATAPAMHALWAAVSRVASPAFAPAALCLAAFAAWQWGDGARALVAAERAQSLEPGYRMAQLLLQVLEAGLDPGLWHGVPASAIAEAADAVPFTRRRARRGP